jgi:hypothetical protein
MCGHAAAWCCLQTAHFHGISERRTTADIIKMAGYGSSYYRPVPQHGTNIPQLQKLFADSGLPALFYHLDEVATDPRLELRHLADEDTGNDAERRLLRVVCTYLNSGFPVIAVTPDREHAVVIIGWRHEAGHNGAGQMSLIVSDHHMPYGRVTPAAALLKQWQHLLVPLPEDVIVSGEAVQHAAYTSLENLESVFASSGRTDGRLIEQARQATDLLRQGQLSVRLQVKRKQAYKLAVTAHRHARGDRQARTLSLLRLPRWVWVVEIQDPQRRARGEPCVLAEFVYDSTSSDNAPSECAVSFSGDTLVSRPYTLGPAAGAYEALTEPWASTDVRCWPSQVNYENNETTQGEMVAMPEEGAMYHYRVKELSGGR